MAKEKEVPASQIDTKFSNISRNDFPEYFIFGTGSSAYQTEGAAQEGGRGPSVWDTFSLKTPGRITGGTNGNVAVDMYHRFEEDIKEMKNMGFDSYRLSISWPRILPNGKVSLGVNKEGIDFYNKVINCLLANGIEPYVTLFHWDLPMSLEQEYGGFLSQKVVNDFLEYAEFCFWKFGDRVKRWITLNEPWAYTVHGYVDGMFPPGEGAEAFAATISKTRNATDSKSKKNYILYKSVDDPKLIKPLTRTSETKRDPATDVYTVARNLLLAHAAVADSYKNKFKGQQNGQIGITLNSFWFEPYNNDTTEDQQAARRALDFMLGWFLEPVLIGKYPENMTNNVPSARLKPFNDEESDMLKGSIDFLGLNYYTARYAENDPNASFGGGDEDGYYKDQKVAFYTEKNGEPIGPPTGSSWQFVVPTGIYKLLKYVNATFNNNTYKLPPIYITENGVGETSNPELTAQEACRDKFRVEFFQAHLGNILNAMNEDKINVRGYFLWTWVDNFEWVFGYTIRFGITYIDYVNYLNRQPKDSAYWFTKFLVKTKNTINNA